MKINLKTVANKTFTVDVEPSDTIAQVKGKITELGEYALEGMKIIFAGKILEDNQTVENAGIQEQHKNIVLIAKKLKAMPQKKKEEPTASTTTAEAPKEETTALPPTATTTPAATTSPSTTTTTATIPLATATTTTPSIAVDENLVNQFLEMGFERAQIVECLQAAFNNAERAAEYLMSGIPDYVKRQLSEQQSISQQQVPQQTRGAQEAIGDIHGGSANQLAQMIQAFPQFNQIRAAIQQNPQLLTPIMQGLAQSNPELVQVINQNPEEFIRLLNEPIPQQAQQQGGAFGGPGGMRPPPGTILVTQQEREAIDRLVGMGFERAIAIQAYFACGKDENLAANFLLENPDMLMDDEEQPPTGGEQEEGDDDHGM